MKILHIIAKNDYEIHVFHQKQDFKLKKKSTQWYIKGSIIIYTKWIKKGFFVYLTQIIHKEKKYFKGGGVVEGLAFFKPAGVPSSLYNSSWVCLDGRTILTFSPGITSKLSVSLLYTTPPFLGTSVAAPPPPGQKLVTSLQIVCTISR